MSILIAHPGTQHVPNLVRGMLDAGETVEYFTSMIFGEKSSYENVIPASILRKRKISSIPDHVLRRQATLEFIPLLAKKFGIADTDSYALRNRIFQRGIPASALKRSSAIIGFDTSSLILEQRARVAGIPYFLELTTPHPLEKQKWSQYIIENFPEWPVDVLFKPKHLIEEEQREVELATVVSVPAHYVKKTHEEFSKTKKTFVINPFGADLSAFHPKSTYGKRPVFVFLGAINAAKGIPVLLKAWELANPDAELLIGGYGRLPPNITLPRNVSMAGSISKEKRLEFFHSADVLICPSFYEGLAIVQLEAAACGLAVIGTFNSGGSEFLTDNEGIFVEPGNIQALALAIHKLSSDALLREKMGRAAAVKARQYSWDAYVQRWITLINADRKTML